VPGAAIIDQLSTEEGVDPDRIGHHRDGHLGAIRMQTIVIISAQ
jgi:hypothetical protein